MMLSTYERNDDQITNYQRFFLSIKMVLWLKGYDQTRRNPNQQITSWHSSSVMASPVYRILLFLLTRYAVYLSNRHTVELLGCSSCAKLQTLDGIWDHGWIIVQHFVFTYRNKRRSAYLWRFFASRGSLPVSPLYTRLLPSRPAFASTEHRGRRSPYGSRFRLFRRCGRRIGSSHNNHIDRFPTKKITVFCHCAIDDFLLKPIIFCNHTGYTAASLLLLFPPHAGCICVCAEEGLFLISTFTLGSYYITAGVFLLFTWFCNVNTSLFAQSVCLYHDIDNHPC